ncbi:hypothetical protein AHF37_09879 [Paragonimus kellicotti]|nr:hypothetical protein AHF37_09879 [Paragonimus kellicotti]
MDTIPSSEWTTVDTDDLEIADRSTDERIFACGPSDSTEDVELSISTENILSSTTAYSPSDNPIHVEVCVSQFNVETFSAIEAHVVKFLRSLGPRHVPTILNSCENHFTLINSEVINQQPDDFLQRCVTSISITG